MPGRRAVAVLALLVLVVGCTRASWTGPVVTPTSSRAPAVPRATSRILIQAPLPEATVTSPIRITGSAPARSGYTLAGQVRSREPDGRLQWRGNGPLAVNAAGSFSGTIAYSLDRPAAGQVDVILIDPVGGTVVETGTVAVRLLRAP